MIYGILFMRRIYDQFYIQWWTIIEKLIEVSTLVIFYFFPLFFIEAIKEIQINSNNKYNNFLNK